jgi:hypothetical protein
MNDYVVDEVDGDSTSEVRLVRPGDPLPPSLVKMIESFGFPIPTGEFELRCTTGGRECFELHPPTLLR